MDDFFTEGMCFNNHKEGGRQTDSPLFCEGQSERPEPPKDPGPITISSTSDGS
jgi:hypothetical protein